MRKSLKKQILRGAQDDKDYVSNFGDRTLAESMKRGRFLGGEKLQIFDEICGKHPQGLKPRSLALS
jgi:hypothetical protein